VADPEYDQVQVQALVVECDQAITTLQQTSANLRRRLDCLVASQTPLPWTRDLRATMPKNPACPGILKGGWWRRQVAAIRTVCFHHTLSQSPVDFAKWYITKEGGRPSTCYTLWITETGETILCGDLEDGVWHNFQGHENLDLSVGLAGNRAVLAPSTLQLNAAARLAAWAIKSPLLPLITSPKQILGHQDYPKCGAGGIYATDCPGWLMPQSGKWKAALYARLDALLLV